jgi:hypothetical protein
VGGAWSAERKNATATVLESKFKLNLKMDSKSRETWYLSLWLHQNQLVDQKNIEKGYEKGPKSRKISRWFDTAQAVHSPAAAHEGFAAFPNTESHSCL